MSTCYVGRHRGTQGGLGRHHPLARGPRPALVASAMLASTALIASLALPAMADPAPSDPVVAAEPAYEDPSEQGDYTSPRPVAGASPGPSVSQEPAPPAATPESSSAPTPEQAAASPTSAQVTAVPRPTKKKAASTSQAPAAAPTKKRAPSTSPAPQKASANRRLAVGTGVVSIASSLSGISYRWGGTTPRGFDCSGYTRYVYRKAGISLPRTAAQQQRATKRVSNPRPGDLVFFGRPAHHVGIYAGNGKMYDAPRRGRSTGLHKIWSSNATYGRAR